MLDNMLTFPVDIQLCALSHQYFSDSLGNPSIQVLIRGMLEYVLVFRIGTCIPMFLKFRRHELSICEWSAHDHRVHSPRILGIS